MAPLPLLLFLRLLPSHHRCCHRQPKWVPIKKGRQGRPVVTFSCFLLALLARAIDGSHSLGDRTYDAPITIGSRITVAGQCRNLTGLRLRTCTATIAAAHRPYQFSQQQARRTAKCLRAGRHHPAQMKSGHTPAHRRLRLARMRPLLGRARDQPIAWCYGR